MNSRKTVRLFISYKTGLDDGLTSTANALRRELEAKGYTVWMDETGIEAGRDWNEQIVENILNSDILLLLVAHNTITSDWVRREVDIARGANVTILPILIRDQFNKQETLDKFDLPRRQYIDYRTGSDDQFEKLLEAIEQRERDTIAKQTQWLTERTRNSRGTPIKDSVQRQGVYTVEVLDVAESDSLEASDADSTPGSKITIPKPKKKKHPCKIYLAVGSITRMKNIDVLVNTENDYMQMARIFESKTISALVRYFGSHISEGGDLLDDTVQEELNAQVKHNTLVNDSESKQLRRPVGVGTVIVTSAGHKASVLVEQNRIRYIFHTAAVSVEGEGTEKRLVPMRDNSSIRRATYNTLKKIKAVNAANGRISPEGTPQRQLQDESSYVPIRSIMLPLFSSGHGGRPASEVVPSILDGIKDYLEEHPTQDTETGTTLHEIYICTYFKEDVEMIRQAFKRASFIEEDWAGDIE